MIYTNLPILWYNLKNIVLAKRLGLHMGNSSKKSNYFSLGISIGVCLGVVVGMLLSNIGIGVTIGAGVGSAIGLNIKA